MPKNKTSEKEIISELLVETEEPKINEKKFYETDLKCNGCGEMIPVRVEMGKSIHGEYTGKKHDVCGKEIIPRPKTD